MSNSVHIQSFLDAQVPTLIAVEEVLNAWDGEGCYQFPMLLASIQAKMNWDDKQLRAKDPIIREYIRSHPDWHVTRGAHGGIMKASEKQKKEEAKLAKEKAKAEINAALDAEVAKKKAEASAQSVAPVVNDTNNLSE